VLSEDVPQDRSSTYAGHKKVIYAKNASGEYQTVQSSGWQIEEAATLDAVELYRELADQALIAVRAGKASPLLYHMYASRMDLPLLSQISGVWQWRIRRHFNPRHFSRASDKLLTRYADACNVSLTELNTIPD